MTVYCPKCQADVTDTFEEADYSTGINPGWYCEACDIGIAEHEVERESFEDDVIPPPAVRDGPIGTPLSEISGRPGHPGYERFCAIARSWGHE
jgi:hypothetical protein